MFLFEDIKRSEAVHGNTKMRTSGIPSILPALSAENKIGSISAADGVDGKKFFIIRAMGSFNNALEIFFTSGDGRKRSGEELQELIEFLFFGFRTSTEFRSIISLDVDVMIDSMHSQPEKDEGDESFSKESREFMRISGKSCASGHINDIPFVKREMMRLYMFIDIFRQSLLVKNVFGIEL
jgi:hypothetical protein